MTLIFNAKDKGQDHVRDLQVTYTYLGQYGCGTMPFFVSNVFWVKEVDGEMRDLNCTSRSRDLMSDFFYLGTIQARAVIFFVSNVYWVKEVDGVLSETIVMGKILNEINKEMGHVRSAEMGNHVPYEISEEREIYRIHAIGGEQENIAYMRSVGRGMSVMNSVGSKKLGFMRSMGGDSGFHGISGEFKVKWTPWDRSGGENEFHEINELHFYMLYFRMSACLYTDVTSVKNKTSWSLQQF